MTDTPTKTAVAFTIAGSDPSGGAGIQADLKTFHQHGVYGAAAIALLTVQNTRGVTRVAVMPADLVREQVAAVLDDIPPDAVKTGALGSAEVIEALAPLLAALRCPLVIDPVMISKHGASLISEDAVQRMRELLFPSAALVTPNAHEASLLSGVEVVDLASAREAARAIADLGPRAVLVKGGHVPGADAVDVLYVAGELHELSAPRIASPHTHGTGCTYSAAITARLALGASLAEAVSGAKGWLTEAILSPPLVGSGIGPVEHRTPITRASVRPPPASTR